MGLKIAALRILEAGIVASAQNLGQQVGAHVGQAARLPAKVADLQQRVEALEQKPTRKPKQR